MLIYIVGYEVVCVSKQEYYECTILVTILTMRILLSA